MSGWWVQFAVLWMRAFKYKLREPAAVMTQATMAILLPALIGGIYWCARVVPCVSEAARRCQGRLPSSWWSGTRADGLAFVPRCTHACRHISLRQSAIFDRLSAISFLILLQGFMCYDQILLIAKERSVYRKDHDAGIYRTSSFYLSRVCAEMPFVVLFAFIAATITYWMYGFQESVGTYLTWCAIIVVVTDAGAALLNSLGALASNMEMANLLATVRLPDAPRSVELVPACIIYASLTFWLSRQLVIVILMLFDGFYINLDNIPDWCHWVHWLSFMSYGVKVRTSAACNSLHMRMSNTAERKPHPQRR